MLLARPPLTELPAETLLARVRGRRAAVDVHGADAAGGPPPQVAIAWVYRRMGKRLRTALTPYLEVEAMQLLLLALRYRLGGEAVPAGLLRQPWLHHDLAGLLEPPGERRAVVAALERRLLDHYPFAAGLTAGYLAGGPGEVEQQLAAGMLTHALTRARSPAVIMTLRFLVDVRNLLAVLRYWRWQLRAAPPLVAGGELPVAQLRQVWADRDVIRFDRLAARLTGRVLDDREPRAAERQLLGGLTVRLRRAGRAPLGAEVIIDYLWRCRVATSNRTLQRIAADQEHLLAEALL
jgi:hypothetical protein